MRDGGASTRRRIVLCTDDSQLAGRLYTAFRQASGLHLAAEARPEDLQQTLAEQRPDACLVAHPLGRANGIDVAARAARRFPGVPVWLLTPTPTAAVRDAARQAGLAGVVDLRITADKLADTLARQAALPSAGPPEAQPDRATPSPPSRRRPGRAVAGATLVLALAALVAVRLADAPRASCPLVRAYVGRRTATVNGQPTRWRTSPVMHAGTVYLPLRDLANAFGAYVRWVPPHTVVLRDRSRTRRLRLPGDRDGPYIQPPGYTMIPLPLAATLFGRATLHGKEAQVSCLTILPLR